MATYYWVGGSGNWDATSTTNWASSSGGAGGAGVPTSADDVIFDAGSNTGTDPFTVTITGTISAPSSCANFTTGGAGGALDGTMTLDLGSTGWLDCYGSMTWPATNFVFTLSGSFTANLRFRASTTGNTFTTNGVTTAGSLTLVFTGLGAWTLGSALTFTNTVLSVVSGSFSSGNFNITVNSLATSGTFLRSMSLGSSVVTLSGGAGPIGFGATTNFTFNAGTSSIVFTNASPTLTGGSRTFYDVSFTSTSGGQITINGQNTFNNFSVTSPTAAGGVKTIVFQLNQTINGTLTLGAANTAINRVRVFGTTVVGNGVGTQVTLTVATIATLSDVDFRDIVAAGASGTWSGTRLGNCGNNSNITFGAGVPKYWNLAAGGNWSATAWALTSGGAVNVNNFPLAQDTAIIENTGLNTGATITLNSSWNLPTIDASTRTNAFTLASGTSSPIIFGSYTIPSVTTVTGTNNLFFGGIGLTQNITTNGVTLTFPIQHAGSSTNTVRLVGNLTQAAGFTLTSGALDLNNNTLTCTAFNSNNSNVRSIAFGTGNITVTGNNATIWSTATGTNYSATGSLTVNATYSGSVGTRTFSTTINIPEAIRPKINISAGTDTVIFLGVFNSLDFTGFSGTLSTTTAFGTSGNLTLSTGMTVASGVGGINFRASSGTQTITFNGRTIDCPMLVNSPGATVAFQDALTQGSTRAFTFTAGTLQFKNGTTNTVGSFLTTGTTQKFLESTLAGSQATLSQATGTVNVSYLTIKDSNATGGATFYAYLGQNNIDAGNNTGWFFINNSAVVGGGSTSNMRLGFGFRI